jgi:hypothetical protein
MSEKPDNMLPAGAYAVAVTGHRDLRPQDLEALRREIRDALKEIGGRAAGARLLVLSGLAEGADQLVAEVALEQGIALAAALPMPLDIYRTQMVEEAQKKLDELLGHCEVTIALPLKGLSLEQIRTSERARAICYETLARFLVERGRALIALWDGKLSDKLGGTCHVVHYARFGRYPGGAEQVESCCETVYHVVTPRLRDAEAAEEIRTVALDCGPHQAAPAGG